MKKFLPLMLILLSAIFSNPVFGQSAHYWSESFGTTSMLLNGTVIGSVHDLGAVYYNPARISQMESSTFVISGQVYDYTKTRIENGLGDGLDLEKSDFGNGPTLVAGTFKLGFLPGHQFAYSFLSRTDFNTDFTFATDVFGDYVNALPGDEYYSGELTATNQIRDEWIGLSWSYPFNERLSIGVSTFYSSFDRNALLKLQLQAYSPTQTITGMYIEKRGYTFESHSLLAKIGLSWKTEKATFGVTMTTPKIQGKGTGTSSYETFLAGIDTTGDGNTNDVYIISNQEDLETKHKSPFSFGLGAGFQIGKNSILHLSSEWYSAIPYYTILKSEPFEGQSTGETLQLEVVETLGSVLNAGLGLEMYLNDNVSLFASFATDFSALDTDPKRLTELGGVLNNTTFRANIWHMGFGTDIKTKFADLTIGATYATANETIDRNITIDDGQDPVTENAKIFYSRWRFIIGFSFPFLDKAKDSLKGSEE
ncbi:MAG: hypothetical protein E2O86_08885 [Bacteroidetes bacterium]|nr:MAG: hypothetical protein E2O86_08885 [Bacteroidota bacterium]